jgi:hypothetical protein
MKLKIEVDTDKLDQAIVKVDGKRIENLERLLIHWNSEMAMGHIRQTIAPEQHQTTAFRAAGGVTEVDVK